MTPELKKEITEAIREFYKKRFPEFPNLEQPRQALAQLPKIYQMLEEKGLIKNEEIPYKYFEAIAVDKFQEMQLRDHLANFF